MVRMLVHTPFRAATVLSPDENVSTNRGEGIVIDLEIDGGLAVVTVDRPEARNAISPATMDELEKALDAVEASGAYALAVTGGGDRAFISGGDLKELATIRTKEGAVGMALRM